MYAILQEKFEKVASSGVLAPIRSRFWHEFQSKGLPSKKMAGYQYIPSTSFAESAFTKSSEDGLLSTQVSGDDPYLIFIEGAFRKELSSLNGLDKSIIIEPMSTAYKTYSSFLSQNFTKSLKTEADPLVLLNLALHDEALFIYIPPYVKVDRPIRIIASASKGLALPRIHLFASKHSSCCLYFETVEGGAYFNAEVFDIIIDEEASVEVYAKKGASRGAQFSFLRANLKDNSFLKAVTFLGNQPLEKADFKVSLSGQNARAELYGLTMPTGLNTAHVNVLMEHIAPHTSSKQHFKGALADFSKASFEGKIYVHKEAMKTDAFQLNNYLLLSPNVIANSKPNLEIFADDVKASHGATVGQLNKEALFYLKSRGIDDKKAKELLIGGFINEIKQLMPDCMR